MIYPVYVTAARARLFPLLLEQLNDTRPAFSSPFLTDGIHTTRSGPRQHVATGNLECLPTFATVAQSLATTAGKYYFSHLARWHLSCLCPFTVAAILAAPPLDYQRTFNYHTTGGHIAESWLHRLHRIHI